MSVAFLALKRDSDGRKQPQNSMTIIATPINFFGLDGLLIFFIMLLLFGAKKLPELARGMGQAIREFAKAKDEITTEMNRPPPPSEEPRQIEQPKAPTTEDPHVRNDHHNQHTSSHV
jgi:sec-independent protein translocase protein TatA